MLYIRELNLTKPWPLLWGGLLLTASMAANAASNIVTSNGYTYTYDVLDTNPNSTYSPSASHLNLYGTTNPNFQGLYQAYNGSTAGQINSNGVIAGNVTWLNAAGVTSISGATQQGFVGSSAVNYSSQISTNAYQPGVNVTGINSSGAITGWYDNSGINGNTYGVPSSYSPVAFYSSSYGGTSPTDVLSGPTAPTGTPNVIANQADGISNNGIVIGTTTYANTDQSTTATEFWTYNTGNHQYSQLPNSGEPANIVSVNAISSNGEYIVGTYNTGAVTPGQYGGAPINDGFVLNTQTGQYIELPNISSTEPAVPLCTVAGSSIDCTGTSGINVLTTGIETISTTTNLSEFITSNYVTGVNNNGTVVGYYNDNVGNNLSFIYNAAAVLAGTTGANSSSAWANKDFQDPNATFYDAYNLQGYTSKGHLFADQNLAPGGTQLLSINDSGVLLGVSQSWRLNSNVASAFPSYFTANASAVPLPGAVWLMGSALFGFGFSRRKQSSFAG